MTPNSTNGASNITAVTVYLRHVRLNQGGYDRSGRYYGIGAPIFEWSFDADAEYDSGELRAYDRDDAKARVLKHLALHYPQYAFTFAR